MPSRPCVRLLFLISIVLLVGRLIVSRVISITASWTPASSVDRRPSSCLDETLPEGLDESCWRVGILQETWSREVICSKLHDSVDRAGLGLKRPWDSGWGWVGILRVWGRGLGLAWGWKRWKLNNQKGSRVFNRLKAISHKQKGRNLPWLTYELVTSLVQCCCPFCLCFPYIYIYAGFLLLLSRLTGHFCFFLFFDFFLIKDSGLTIWKFFIMLMGHISGNGHSPLTCANVNGNGDGNAIRSVSCGSFMPFTLWPVGAWCPTGSTSGGVGQKRRGSAKKEGYHKNTTLINVGRTPPRSSELGRLLLTSRQRTPTNNYEVSSSTSERLQHAKS